MIDDFEFHYEQTGIKEYRLIAILGHVWVSHTIDELEDPYCLTNLVAFASALRGNMDAEPEGKLYSKHWRVFSPSWIAYESDKQFTWKTHGVHPDRDQMLLRIRSGLPYQSKPVVKIDLKVNRPAFAKAILVGFRDNYKNPFLNTA